MIWFLHLLRRPLRGWRLYLLLLAAVFALTWVLMALFEPPEATIDKAENFWWWFFVTAFTVGYGDLFPVSLGGRLGALLVMATAIGVVAALVNDFLEHVSARRSAENKGVANVKEKDHYVVLGYSPERTSQIVQSILAENVTSHVVVAANPAQVEENPFPEEKRVSFVRGILTNEEVLQRANIAQARVAIVDTPDADDDRAALIALVVGRFNQDLHTVVAVADIDRISHLLEQFHSEYECVEWTDTLMVTEAAMDPGITRFHADLRVSETGSNTYSLTIPASVDEKLTLSQLLLPLKQHHNAIVVAVAEGEEFRSNPPLDTALHSGAIVYYIGPRRLSWEDVTSALVSAS